MNVVSEFITTINTVVQSGAASNAAKIAKAISPVLLLLYFYTLCMLLMRLHIHKETLFLVK